ncbi:hypothetical protein Ancab_002028 [Ancistrocladus abbreviatus]
MLLLLLLLLVVPSAMNRSFNRENPDILIVMIAVKEQIIRGNEDKEEINEREKRGREGTMGPPCAEHRNEWHCSRSGDSSMKCFLLGHKVGPAHFLFHIVAISKISY